MPPRMELQLLAIAVHALETLVFIVFRALVIFVLAVAIFVLTVFATAVRPSLKLVLIAFIAFVTAAVVAVPLLVRKRMRIAREEKEIRESPDPAKARKILAKKKREMHFADDPDYLAFGPFLGLGTVLFLLY